MRRRLGGVTFLIAAIGLSACKVQVTPDGSAYTYKAYDRGSTVVVTAPSTSGGHNREFFWSQTSPTEADSTVCATFASGQGVDQQGVVLRLNRTLVDGVQEVDGITVTRNVYLDIFDDFNFHVWNTAADPSNPFTQFGDTVIPGLPFGTAFYPLSMCAQTVTATNTVQFVVWTAWQTQPPWGSTTQGGSATIPAGAPATGQGGWFAGHLLAGTSMTYTRLTVDGVVPVDPA
jgi:hypothetical protein